MTVLAALTVTQRERISSKICQNAQVNNFPWRPSFYVDCRSVSKHVEDAMRDLPHHAKIQRIITACTCSRVREHLLQDHTWLWRLNTLLLFGPAFLGPLWLERFSAVLCRQHGTCGLCSLSISHRGHGRHAKRRLRPPPCCGGCEVGFVVRCFVCVQVVDVGMYVCGAACYAWCGVLQRRHNFDAFLKRFGTHHPLELVRHWIRTATSGNLSDYGLCRHLRLA